MLSQAAERRDLGRVPTGLPLLRVPAAGARSRGPAPALTSRAAAPGCSGPGRAEWPRAPLRPPQRCLRRRGWRLRREAAGRPGRLRLAPTNCRSSLTAALAASACGPCQKAFPSRPAHPAARTGTSTVNRKVPLGANRGRSNPSASSTADSSLHNPVYATDDRFPSECGTEIPGRNPPGNGSTAGSNGKGLHPSSHQRGTLAT